MEAILIILFLSFVFLKHFGAVARESHINSHMREYAKRHNESTYAACDGTRYVHNNHKVVQYTDPYLGRILEDQVTGKRYYQDLEELKQEYRETKDRAFDLDDSVWQGQIGQKYIYIDRKTDRLMWLAKVDPWHDVNCVTKDPCNVFFYVDFNKKKIIRRTKRQMKYEREHGQIYSDAQLEAYKDKYASPSCSGTMYRDSEGNWIPQIVEPYWL